ncbi:zinc carboxypeptidase [Naegleria gruberi]|uniref:Zinc carboxypeptidase n=1 Tax=Naegleria gruberi TaxID=5762 RepID=D2VBZ4_NAEGR|nr:zinc carboxypeptidase [Naegleria gruberi]EFC45660.1 zinc carboxypeptidase [Naegleria gruberi]|eukprot:XP_002678404.1 zinc carboxypeptidase [Naegleria gruberi strain NEG-M]
MQVVVAESSNALTLSPTSSTFEVKVGGFSSVDKLKSALEKHVKPLRSLYSSFDIREESEANNSAWIVSLHNEKQVDVLEGIIKAMKMVEPDSNYFISKLYKQSSRNNERSIRKTSNLLSYHNYVALTAKLNSLKSQYPNMTSLFSVGQSVESRELWVLKIYSNTTVGAPNYSKYQKPKFKYIANMHGDETVGREMILYFAEYLLTEYMNGNSRIRNIIDYMDVYLMPSMNPDGFERGQRENANGVDLNRDFPDQFLTSTQSETYQVETQAMMKWIQSENFVLSANFHGGATVASYPYDSAKGASSGQSVESFSPDDSFFKLIAKGYANAHTTMKNSLEFPGGYTNGAEWYVLFGGMQDFNYWKKNCFEITIELSDTKYPSESTLDSYWNQNKESLLTYMEYLRYSIVGIVTDSKGNPVSNANVTVEGIAKNITTFDNGMFFRLLPPGTYNIKVAKDSYTIDSQSITINSNSTLGQPTFAYFSMMSSAPPSYSSYGFKASSSIRNSGGVVSVLKHNSISMANTIFSIFCSKIMIVAFTLIFTILH